MLLCEPAGPHIRLLPPDWRLAMRRLGVLLAPFMVLSAAIVLALALDVRSAPAQTPEPRTGIRVIGQG